jgi:hypothetical protein
MDISNELERILGEMDEDEKRKLEESNTAKQMALLAEGGAVPDVFAEYKQNMYRGQEEPKKEDLATQFIHWLSNLYFPGLVADTANVPMSQTDPYNPVGVPSAQQQRSSVYGYAGGGGVGYHQPDALEQNMLALGGVRAMPIIMALHKAQGGRIDLPKFADGGEFRMDSDSSIPNPPAPPSLAEKIPTGLTQDGIPQLAPITVTAKREEAPWYEGLLGAADLGKTLLGGAVGMVPAAIETGARVLGGSPMKAEDIYSQALSHYTPDLLTQRGKEMGEDLSGFMERNKIPLVIPELMPFEEALGVGAGAAMRKSDEALKAIQPAHGEFGSNLGNVFYSALDNAAQGIKRGVGTGAEFLQELMGKGGIKKAEIEDRGLDALANAGKMTKEQMLEELQTHGAPQIQERILKEEEPNYQDLRILAHEIYHRENGLGRNIDYQDAVEQAREILIDEQDETTKPHYENYTLPGGENYREMLLHLPRDRMNLLNNFNSSHFGVPNILTHMRLKDREGLNGEKLLNLEELQSDWHQAGKNIGYRKTDAEIAAEQERINLEHQKAQELKAQGLFNELKQVKEQLRSMPAESYYDPMAQQLRDKERNIHFELGRMDAQEPPKLENIGILNGPFKKNWDEMALKRLIHHAAANDYDGIAVTPGDVQANRYNLEKFIGSIRYQPSHKLFEAFNPEGTPVLSKVAEPHELSDYIGKDVADRLIKTEPVQGVHKLSGLDLRSGGEGMKGFYDKKVPTILNNIGKKYGVKTELNGVTSDNNKFHYFPITPEMKKDVLQNGLPMYRDGGLVQI